MAGMSDVNRIMALSYLPAYERQRELLDKPGFSERCGIPEVEKLARETRELEKKNVDWMIAKCRELIDSPPPHNRDPVVVELGPAVMGTPDEDVVDDLRDAFKGQDTAYEWFLLRDNSLVRCVHKGPSGPFPFFSGDVAGRVHLREVNERLWVGW